MNSNMGEGNGKLWYGPSYHQIYLKEGDIIDPTNKWVVVDEHPDSMNDGSFFTNMTTPTRVMWICPARCTTTPADTALPMAIQKSRNGTTK